MARKFQSTHPRGVRRHRSRSVVICLSNFNPRTHEGCDLALAVAVTAVAVFQSTHPRGVRHLEPTWTWWQPEFQSTHPRGVRPHKFSRRGNGDKISIHAPTRGATKYSQYDIPSDLFQSTHPRGVRRDEIGQLTPWEVISIHAPTRGATLDQCR